MLTTGALSFLMESAYRGHERIETPALRVTYTAPVAIVLRARNGLLMPGELDSLIAPHAVPEKVAGGFGLPQGPVFSRRGYLLFSDTAASRIMKWEAR